MSLYKRSKELATAKKDSNSDGFDVAPLEAIVGFSLRMAQLRIFDDFSHRMRRMQLRPSEYSVLTLIRHNPGCHAAQIAEVLSIKRPNFVALLTALEDRNLVTRKRSADDKRMFQLQLTKSGQAFLKRADVLVADQEAEISKLLGPQTSDLVNMLKALRKLPSKERRPPSTHQVPERPSDKPRPD